MSLLVCYQGGNYALCLRYVSFWFKNNNNNNNVGVAKANEEVRKSRQTIGRYVVT